MTLANCLSLFVLFCCVRIESSGKRVLMRERVEANRDRRVTASRRRWDYSHSVQAFVVMAVESCGTALPHPFSLGEWAIIYRHMPKAKACDYSIRKVSREMHAKQSPRACSTSSCC